MKVVRRPTVSGIRVTVGELATRYGATVVGDKDLVICGVAGIDEASPGEMSFISNPRYHRKLFSTKASAAIVPKDIAQGPLTLLLSDNPYLTFAKVLGFFHPEERPAPGISDAAWIGKESVIGEGCSILPLVCIGHRVRIGPRTIIHPGACIGEDVSIGEDCLIYSNASVREGCVLGNRVIVHSGTVIGSDGFGFAREGARHFKIPQIGIVRIEDDVEIGANCCVDRATMGETVIGRGTKLDNLVQVAHNVRVGEDVILVAQVGISGSTEIGDRAMLGGQVGVVGHRRLGDDVRVGAKSGIHTNIPDGHVVAGIPAMPYQEFLKTIAIFKNLPRIRERIRKLEKEIRVLKEERGKDER